MSAKTWRIEMLGGFRLQRGNIEITRFKSRKVAALAAYLAFYPTRPHNREELQTLLWPDDTIDAARNSLRVALSLLRRQLEPEGTLAGTVVSADRQAVWLNVGTVETDTGEFDSMYAAALHTEDDAELPKLLRSTVEAYKGELLGGFYEEWVLAERARLSECYLQALRKLVRVLAASRDYEHALEYARAALQMDPLREEAARDVMRLLLALHQPSAALQQYKELESRLLEALNSRPASATRELARRIVESQGSAPAGKETEASPEAYREAPAPQSAVARPARLPAPTTRFFGREHEMAQMHAWATTVLQSSPERPVRSRLMTLTGPGGVGKTRLSLEMADELQKNVPGLVWFVPLADLTAANQIADAIADALHLSRAEIGDLAARIDAMLSGRPSILVLDNFEHVVEAGAPLVRMLQEQAPTLAFLVTSRRVLGLHGERELPVGPLPVPIAYESVPPGAERSRLAYGKFGSTTDALNVLAENSAVQLFLDRGRAVDSSFGLTANNAAAVSALCRQLDGLPLAIELAAARIRVLTPDQMLTYLTRRRELLVDPNADKDGRHRSLRAAIEWSYRLLSPDERRLFARLSVFEGGWTLEAASAICDDAEILEALEQMRMSSLIQTLVCGGEVRFRMLEMLRGFAFEQMSGEERSKVQQAHARYFLHLAEEADFKLKGTEEALWMQRLQLEHDNMRAALRWFADEGVEGEEALRLVGSLWRFWSGRGYLREGREMIDLALNHPGAGSETLNRAKVLMYAGDLAVNQGEIEAAESLLNQSSEIYGKLGSGTGVANSLNRLGLVRLRAGRYDESRALQEESLAMHRSAGNAEGVAVTSSYLGLLLMYQGDYILARSYQEACLAYCRDSGSRRNLAVTLGNLGVIAEHLGEYAAARGLQEESLSIHRELGTQAGIASAVSNLAILLIKLGDREGGRKRLLEGMALFRDIGSKHSAVISIDTLAAFAVEEQDYSSAAWLYGVAEGGRQAIGAALMPRDQGEHERDYGILREKLGDERFYLEFTKGRATKMEHAMAELLGEFTDPIA